MTNHARSRPDIVLGNDILGMMISDALVHGVMVPFRREYHPDGSPIPMVDMKYTLNNYEDFEGKHILTVYRRHMLPSRDDVARHLTNYPRLVANLTNTETFNVRQVDVVYPYWICGRQDHNPRTDPDEDMRRREKGRGIEYENDATFFKAAGARRILTFHPHFHRMYGVTDVKGIEVACLDAVPAMVEYARNEFGIGDGDWLVVNPDLKPTRKGYDIALAFARYAELPSDHLEMARAQGSEKIIQGDDVDAKGRNVLIVDDIGSTFGTMETAIRHIEHPGRVYAEVVHATMPHEGLNRLRSMLRDSDCPLKGVAATHTIDSDISVIPIHNEVTEFYTGNDKYRQAAQQAGI